MQLHFDSISEPTQAGPKWQKLFYTYWPGYKAWLNSKDSTQTPSLKTSQAALAHYMPEMMPTYKHLCQLVHADELAARFLTGFQPPAYVSACSQAVQKEDTIQLVHNYDYHPELLEGTLLLSAWNGKKVIVNGDCLIGAVDGMNEDGLVISLTFGGRKAVGEGFGIPFILRYVLEFCKNVKEAVEVLTRIPSNSSYNVLVVDKSGAFRTVQMAPDRVPIITDAAFTTNHQGTVDWPENAQFNKTLERSAFLKKLLSKKVSTQQLSDAFLQPPLYNTDFAQGFGTLYTSIYKPVEGIVQMRWPNESLVQSFDNFREGTKLINFKQSGGSNAIGKASDKDTPLPPQPAKNQDPTAGKKGNEKTHVNPENDTKGIKSFREIIIHRGQNFWKIVEGFWTTKGKGY